MELELVEQARAGNKESFGKLYDLYAKDLYRVAVYTLGNKHDAEDVVSETFIEAFQGIGKLREAQKAKAWFLRILSNRCKRKIKDYIKARRQDNLEAAETTLPVVADFAAETTERLEIAQALKTLNEDERLVIGLATIQGYTVKETAQILDSPQGTVSAKLYRALAKLKKIMVEKN